MGQSTNLETVDILLVEDNPGDVRLTQEVLKDGKLRNRLSVVGDGVEALDYMHRRGKYTSAVRPDLMLLDLNLPKLDGRAVLAEIKSDAHLRSIPIIILTTSSSDTDVLASYDLQANCYIAKPLELAQFTKVVCQIREFWLTIVKLPSRERQ